MARRTSSNRAAPSSSSTLPTVSGRHSCASAAYTGVSTSRILPLSPTTTTPPTCAAPDTMRCPTPISLARPRAFTLYSPGQYSPGTSPTRASTPSRRSADAMSDAVSRKRASMFWRGSRSGIVQVNATVSAWNTAAVPPTMRFTDANPRALAASTARA